MSMDSALPPGLLLAYYGDDFTGSTDAMESFTAAGVPTVLFFQPPTSDALRRFPQARAVGLAGSQGTQTCQLQGQWGMQAHAGGAAGCGQAGASPQKRAAGS